MAKQSYSKIAKQLAAKEKKYAKLFENARNNRERASAQMMLDRVNSRKEELASENQMKADQIEAKKFGYGGSTKKKSYLNGGMTKKSVYFTGGFTGDPPPLNPADPYSVWWYENYGNLPANQQPPYERGVRPGGKKDSWIDEDGNQRYGKGFIVNGKYIPTMGDNYVSPSEVAGKKSIIEQNYNPLNRNLSTVSQNMMDEVMNTNFIPQGDVDPYVVDESVFDEPAKKKSSGPSSAKKVAETEKKIAETEEKVAAAETDEEKEKLTQQINDLKVELERAKSGITWEAGNFAPSTTDKLMQGMGMAGSFMDNIARARQINRTRPMNAPMYMESPVLETRMNISPQLNEARNAQAIFNRGIDRSAMSGGQGMAAKASAYAGRLNAANKMYGEKSNRELALRNRQRQLSAQTANQNRQMYGQYRNNLTNFENARLGAIAQNAANFGQDLSSIGSDYMKNVRSPRMQLEAYKPLFSSMWKRNYSGNDFAG